ncbi:MAG TPA: PVC-type heme-binding CxxCH protein [Gemmataceae bacterium]|nr:PVC-type heme-binding CxxCH protein [Gemmataceae bacterium]
MRLKLFVATAIAVVLAVASSNAQQKEKPKWPPSPHVAATDPLRPEEQVKKIKLPPGFELQLVAADPDIRKPININFDAAGRLWITETIEYPFPAPAGKGRDAVKILEDFGPDGKARKITTFADKLNIPIGVIPDGSATSALIYTIPAIYRMADTKGTGHADKRDFLYGEFGYRDTHGMTGEFQQGFDGWIYACHGYANTSNIKSRGETAISLTSGNTYRIKPDGSRIEQWTWGQVNPFGLAFDPLGNLYSGDCHSEPLTMLLRHGWYVSFGKPHDGVGFAPHMNTFGNQHSTALCGVAYYAADQYPPEYRGRLFLGDVVNNRINSYQIDWSGASPKAVMKEFLTSSDPWFRPVDIKLGPDGCLYFADFYNRIIGHYEVDLKHPGRDRDKGRIWRIVYRGPTKDNPQPVTNLVKADVATLLQSLYHSNLTVRLQATHQLVERGGKDAIDGLQRVIKLANASDKGATAKVHAMWALERLGKLDDDTLVSVGSADSKELRVHVQRILSEKAKWSPKYAALAKLGLDDKEPMVQRVAAEALAAHPAPDHIAPLAKLRWRVPPADTHLLYAVRLALREQLKNPESWMMLARDKGDSEQHKAVYDVCLGIRSADSAQYLKAQAEKDLPYRDLNAVVRHIVRYGADGSTTWALEFARTQYAKNQAAQGDVLKAVIQGAQERGIKLGDADRAAASKIVEALIDQAGTLPSLVGAEMAGTLKVASTQPRLLALVSQPTTAEPLRKACITSLVQIDAKGTIAPLGRILLDDKEAIQVREQVANALAGVNHPDAHAELVKALQNAPARVQATIALGMAGTPQGGERLLQAIEAGKASRQLLQDRAVELRLRGAKINDVKGRLAKLTAGLPAADAKSQAAIAKQRDAFASFKSDAVAGQKIFQKHCAACHQIASKGGKIGPNLDGIGARGLERLLEDVLDPNRNVDQAFRSTVITTKNGQTVTGLFLREEGKIVVLGDKDGKEVRIEKGLIDERAVTPLSLMPSNFVESISEPDLHHLMAYLLEQRVK